MRKSLLDHQRAWSFSTFGRDVVGVFPESIFHRASLCYLVFRIIARQIAIRSRGGRTFLRSENSLAIHLAFTALAMDASATMLSTSSPTSAVASWSRGISSAEHAVWDRSVRFLSAERKERDVSVIRFLKGDESRLCFDVLLAQWRVPRRKEVGCNPAVLTWKQNFSVYYQVRQMADDNVGERRHKGVTKIDCANR